MRIAVYLRSNRQRREFASHTRNLLTSSTASPKLLASMPSRELLLHTDRLAACGRTDNNPA